MGNMNYYWFNLEIETQNQCHVNTTQIILDLERNSFWNIILTSLDWNFVSKTWNKSWCIHIDSLESNSSPKTKFEKVYLWNSLFFLVNHGDELTGRWTMRLKKWFIQFWILFLGFPYILGGVGHKISELGSHLTEFGRACIDWTQNLRKTIWSTWVMNRSPCERFLDLISPWSTLNVYILNFPEIWFEMEHFKILGFSGPRLRVPPVTSWAWNGSRSKFSWILEIFKF